MAITQNLNVNPYYDDFDETKGYNRILFRPGYAVQARELTQLQTMMQKQIERFGQHVFKEGSMVLGGQTNFENSGVYYIKLQDNNSSGIAIDVNNFVGKFIKKVGSNNVRAYVLAVADKTTTDPKTLAVKYFSPGIFASGDAIEDEDGDYTALLAATQSQGFCSILSINDGVFFIDGFFAKVNAQTIFLDKYGTTPSYRVGLEVTDSIVTESSDTSLLDPALDASNYQAPGATRLKIELILAKRSLSSIDDSKFIELIRIEEGVIKSRTIYPQYSVLEETLARRTFDESGDYTVRPFNISFSDDGISNNGIGFANSYNIIIGPGKAYVKGYEFETISPTVLVAPRARDFATESNYPLTLNYQNYIDVTNLTGPIDLKEFTKLDVHCVPHQSINTTSAATIAATNIGSIRIRALDYQYGANTTAVSNAIFRAYVFEPSIGRFTANAPGRIVTITANTNSFSPSGNVFLTFSGGGTGNTAANARIVVNSVTNLIQSINVISGGVYTGIPTATAAGSNAVFTITTASGTANSINLHSTASSQNNAYFGVKLTISNDTGNSETKVIQSYNGVTKVASFDSNWTTIGAPGANTIFSLDYEFKDTESFVITDGAANVSTRMNISNDSKFSILTDDYQGAYITDPQYDALIFSLPQKYIKEDSITNNEYFGRKVYDGTFTADGIFGSAGGFGTGSGITSAVTGSPVSTTDAIDNFFVVLTSTGTTFANNTIINFFNPANTVSVTTSANTSTVTIRCPGANNATARVYMKVKLPYPEELPSGTPIRKLKTVRTANTNIVSTTGGENISGANVVLFVNETDQPGIQLNINRNSTANLRSPALTQSLYVADVFNLKKVLDFGTYTANTTNIPNATDITDSYQLAGGQTLSAYKHSFIYLIPGSKIPTGNVVIYADYYSHSGTGYFSIDSYVGGGIDYRSVPSLLRDSIDFRPRLKDGLSGTNGQYDETVIGISGTNFETDFAYYFPRIDKLIVTKDRKFQIVQGVSSFTPKPPADRGDAMTIYTLILPPYVSRPSEIIARYVDNRRYTMRDIGGLEQRIQNLEYFTTLSLLEEQTVKETFVDDSTGLPRVKSGVVVDPFVNYNVTDVSNEDYRASVDPVIGFVRPSFVTSTHSFEVGSGSNFRMTSTAVTPKYTSNTFISQTSATSIISINPNGSNFSLAGSITTSPASTLPDTNQAPDTSTSNQNNTNGNFDACARLYEIEKIKGRERKLIDKVLYQEYQKDRINLRQIIKANTTIGTSLYNALVYRRGYRCYKGEWRWWERRVRTNTNTARNESTTTNTRDVEVNVNESPAIVNESDETVVTTSTTDTSTNPRFILWKGTDGLGEAWSDPTKWYFYDTWNTDQNSAWSAQDPSWFQPYLSGETQVVGGWEWFNLSNSRQLERALEIYNQNQRQQRNNEIDSA